MLQNAPKTAHNLCYAVLGGFVYAVRRNSAPLGGILHFRASPEIAEFHIEAPNSVQKTRIPPKGLMPPKTA
eukprot:7505745-Alexandrium_andersonii.AAC.1